MKGLPAGTSLADAVRFFAERHPSAGGRKLVPEVVAEYIQDRTAAGVSDIHQRDLRIRLGRFGDAFHVPITSVTAAMVNDYLKTLTNALNGRPASPRGRANYRAPIIALFNFARLQRYVSRDHAAEIADVPVPKFRHGKVEVYHPDEFRRLLHAAGDDLRPVLALGGFAGLRVAELNRLDWRDVKLAERVIIVGDRIAKTASSRVVPIGDALAAWLAPHARPFGPVSPAQGEARGVGEALINRWARLAVRAKIKWKRNALRHSFGSYRLAVTADLARHHQRALPRPRHRGGGQGVVPHSARAHRRRCRRGAHAPRWYLTRCYRVAILVPVIVGFACEKTARLWTRERGHGFPPAIGSAALRKLTQLHRSRAVADLRVPPGNRLEALKGSRKGQFSIRINDQWRVCFRWEGEDAREVEIVDYH